MSQWRQGKQWSGNYWGTGRGKAGKGKSAKGKEKDKEKERTQDKNEKDSTGKAFPSYDSMVVTVGEPSTSSMPSSQDGDVWQAAFKSLIASNPSLKVPEEIMTALGQSGPAAASKDSKQEIYQQQKMLNLKRKMGQKIERLQNAATRKQLQMASYQDHMRATLKKELEKFAVEKKDIQAQLAEAQEQMERLERGEMEIGETEEPFIDSSEELAGLLGMNSKTDNARSELEFQKLQNEKQYLASMAMQLQEQINFIMANGGATAVPVNPVDALKLSPKRSSPQATIPPVGPFKRVKTGEDIKDSKNPECEDLTGMDS